MGFLDKIKSVTKSLTGGAADVSLKAEPFVLGSPFTIVVSATIDDQDVQSRGVYLKIEGLEEISIPREDVIYEDNNADPGRHRERIRARAQSFSMEYPVAEGGELKADSSHEWPVEVTIPNQAIPIFEGRFSRHRIRAKAGIDCSGNDPDSGWIDLTMQS